MMVCGLQRDRYLLLVPFQVSLTVRFVQITFYLKEIEGQIISWCNLCISKLGVIKY